MNYAHHISLINLPTLKHTPHKFSSTLLTKVYFSLHFPVCFYYFIFFYSFSLDIKLYSFKYSLTFIFPLYFGFDFAGIDLINKNMGKTSVLLVGFLFSLLIATVQAGDKYKKYNDPSLPISQRIRDLMRRMNLDEKIGQMVQIDRKVATPEVMRDCKIGSILSGGGSVPHLQATPQEWINMVNGFQNGSLSTRLGIPMIYGIDAVHGHNNVYKATIFPHNIGLGATR